MTLLPSIAPQATLDRRDVAGIALLIVLASVLRLSWFGGVYGHDDWSYLFLIRSYLNGRYDEVFSAMWGLRFQVWYPVHLWFKTFGVSYAGAFFPGFVTGLASIPVCWMALRFLGFGVRIAALGGVVLVLSPIDWLVSGTLRGDIEMSFYGGLLVLLLVLTRRAEGAVRNRLAAALGFAWGLSALSKDWGLVFGWGFCAVGLADWWDRRRFPREYLITLAVFLAVMAADTTALRYATGEWFHRQKISANWYAAAAASGGYDHDDSLSWRYLPDIFLGRQTEITQSGPWANRYPYLGPYLWLFLIALPVALITRGTARIVAWFSVGVLLWVEFGSMQWNTYLPFHKEPRYFSMLSVPVAVIVAAGLARIFQVGVPRFLRLAAGGGLTIWAVAMVNVAIQNRATYSEWRDFVPALTAWLETHPHTRLWTKATIQNELDLRLGYRFASPMHHQAGVPGFGSIQDIWFFHEGRSPGDLVVLKTDGSDLATMTNLNRMELKHVAFVAGPVSSAEILAYYPVPRRENGYYLSDEHPEQINDSYTAPRWNVSFSGGPLRMHDRIVPRGILVHARSELIYRLDSNCANFSTTIGMAESSPMPAPGSVVFSVYVDNELRFQSKVFRPDTPSENVTLDVKGAHELRLLVEDAGDGNHSDHAIWGAPYLAQIRQQ